MHLHVPNPAFVVTHQTGDDGITSIHIGNVDAGPVAELILHPGQHVEVSRDDFVYLHIPGFGCELLLADPAEAVAAPADPRGDFLKAGWAFSHAIAGGDACSDGTCLRCRLAKVLADVEHQAAQVTTPSPVGPTLSDFFKYSPEWAGVVATDSEWATLLMESMLAVSGGEVHYAAGLDKTRHAFNMFLAHDGGPRGERADRFASVLRDAAVAFDKRMATTTRLAAGQVPAPAHDESGL